MITGDLEPGDDTVGGNASPGCNLIQICEVGGGGVTPSSPPCTAPDTLLGSGPASASGHFNIPIAPPLENHECIYAFDTCTALTSAVRCAVAPAPAPALSGRALQLAVGVLGLVALLGLARRRRDAGP
ncbi:MAG TPA: hypothetical protein VL049_24700 [Candidatus Dormibacteraeota bacterium]|nr:hypothetical protein [Candidatus Dormibacteraeota bacterium]